MWKGNATGFGSGGKVSNLLIATNMAAKEKAKDSNYNGFLSAVRPNKSESLVAGKLWYRNLCKKKVLVCTYTMWTQCLVCT